MVLPEESREVQRSDSVETDDDVFAENDLDESQFSDDDGSSDCSSSLSSVVVRLLRSSSGRRRTDGSSSTADVRHVALRRLLGSGGFGSVYLGELDGQRVALKVPRRPSSAQTDTTRESFRAEAKLLGLRHPNVVRVVAVGWTDSADVIDGRSAVDSSSGSSNSSCEDVDAMPRNLVPTVVMEFAGERNLQTIIDEPRETIDVDRRIRFASDMTSALAYIHERRIVHLDLKPANVIVTHSDNCKLIDFGCSQRLATSGSSSSVDEGLHSIGDDDEFDDWEVRRDDDRRPSPAIQGTLAYRAPELFCGAPVSCKADVYSLGVTLWQLARRSFPYAGRDWHAVVFAVVAFNDRPDSPTPSGPRTYCPSVSTPIAVTSSSSVDSSSFVDEAKSTPTDATYSAIYRNCWSAKPEARPTAAQLAAVFDVWKACSTNVDEMLYTKSSAILL